MNNVVDISAARRTRRFRERMQTQPRPRRDVQEIPTVFLCGECKAVVDKPGWCVDCVAELERRQHEFRRYQERRAASQGLCPGCMQPAPRTILGWADGFVSYHPSCLGRRVP